MQRKQGQNFDKSDHITNLKTIANQNQIYKDNTKKKESESCIHYLLPETKKRVFIRTIHGNSSQWLTVTPISADKVRDALALGYVHSLRNLPLL